MLSHYSVQLSSLCEIALFPMGVICQFLSQQWRFQLAATCAAFWSNVTPYMHVEHLTSLQRKASCQSVLNVWSLTLARKSNLQQFVSASPCTRQLTINYNSQQIRDSGATGLSALKECPQLQQLTLHLGHNSIGGLEPPETLLGSVG